MSLAEARGRVVLAVAPNGGRKTKADHPALPLTADELARDAAECLERGASMIHLHVRDAEGRHCLDPEAYRAAIARICEAVGDRLVIQITSEALGLYSPAEQRAAVLKTNPEAVSLALREFAPEGAGEKAFGAFLGELRQMRIHPQIILYTPGEAERLGGMMKQGLIPFDRLSVLYVLGRFALTRTAIPRDLLPFLAPDMPRFSPWSVCAFGRREAACVTAAALLGGHARVGFENNVALPDGERAASNAELVGAAASALEAVGLAVQSAEGLREEIAAAIGA
ncbi:MAG TPA: 3-keto-5-aminohexanoate cleavage protein [Roseiarcus sp.]|nr:3-keto-5-aminohexanoate cleavage protein [Roseiarcus sp.]